MHTIMHFHEQNGLKRQISLLWGGEGEAVVKLDLIVVAKGLVGNCSIVVSVVES